MEKELEKYLNNEMSPKELKLFEERLNSDIELKEKVNIYKNIDHILSEDNYSSISPNTKNDTLDAYEDFLKSDDGQEILKNIKVSNKDYLATSKKNNQKRIFIYAASIAAIFVFTFFSIQQFNSKPNALALYENYKNWENLPSFGTKDVITDNFLKKINAIEIAVNKGEYKKSLELINNIESNSSLYSKIENKDALLLYKGVSLLETNHTNSAIQVLIPILKNKTYNEIAQWYLSLAYLKANDIESSKTQLQYFKNCTNDRCTKAKELLEKLE